MKLLLVLLFLPFFTSSGNNVSQQDTTFTVHNDSLKYTYEQVEHLLSLGYDSAFKLINKHPIKFPDKKP